MNLEQTNQTDGAWHADDRDWLPAARSLALEARLMFDGAALVAADAGVLVTKATEPAVNVVRGTLWDDTRSANDVPESGEARLANVQVTLTHAGADGRLDTVDDVIQVTRTDANGAFVFAQVADGVYRLSVPTSVSATENSSGSGALCVRFDAQGDRRDGVMVATVSGGVEVANHQFGYVQINDPPQIIAPDVFHVLGDAKLAVTGIVVTDPDAATDDVLTVRVTASSGVLNLELPAGSTVVLEGNGSGALRLSGTLAGLNQALAKLVFQKPSGECCSVTLDVKVDDNGARGDGNGDGVPSGGAADNQCAEAKICIEVKDPNNVAPVTEHVVQVISQAQGGRPVLVVAPMVRDLNDPNSALVVSIDSITHTEAGYFVLPDGSRVVAGQRITVDQLQRLSYVANAAFVGARASDGSMQASRLGFSVIDPCGETACGSIEIRLTPVQGHVPPDDRTPPLPPVDVNPFVIPPNTGGWTRPDPIVLAPLPRPDLDAGGLFPSGLVNGFFGDERIGPLAPAPAEEPAPAPVEDVAPLPKPKPKPKPIVKEGGDGLSKPVPKFTDQLDGHKKKLDGTAKAGPARAVPGKR